MAANDRFWQQLLESQHCKCVFCKSTAFATINKRNNSSYNRPQKTVKQCRCSFCVSV